MNIQERLDEIRQKLMLIGGSDEDDPKIDPGILETLVVLNALGINTSMSCEGHVWSDREDPLDDGPNYGPYVDISGFYLGKFDYEDDMSEDLPKLTEDEDLARSLQQEQDISDMQEKLLGWLQEFYSSRRQTEEVRLIISRPGLSCNSFTISSQGVWIKRTGERHRSFLREAQAEMAEFTSFLKQKYLAE